MKKHIHLLLLAVAIAIITLIHPNRVAYACTCVPLGTAKEELRNSDFVFKGKVTSIIPIGISSYSVSFDIERVWKGIGYKSVTLKEVYCPIYQTPSAMIVGKEYIIYSKGEATNLTFGMCSRVIESQYISNEIIDLGVGEYPTIDYPIYLRQEFLIYFYIVSLLIFTIMICMLLIKRKNIRKSKT